MTQHSIKTFHNHNLLISVSRRASRSYSHQTFVQYTPKGVFGYRTQTYTETDHFYTPNNMNYYQPNQYHYHSTPWRYRWGRSAEEERERRAAEPRLGQISDIKSIPVNSISRVAENVSIAYQPEVWTNDMIFKVKGVEGGDVLYLLVTQDQDDCSKRLLCELNAKKASSLLGMTENEEIIASSYGKTDSIDINAESLEFDIAAVLGRVVMIN